MSERRNESFIKKVWREIKCHWRNPLLIVAIMAYIACMVVGFYDLVVCWNNVRNAVILVGLTVAAMLAIILVFVRDANNLFLQSFLTVLGLASTGILVSGVITSMKWIGEDPKRIIVFMSVLITLLVIYIIQLICGGIDKAKHVKGKKQIKKHQNQQRMQQPQYQAKPNAKR